MNKEERLPSVYRRDGATILRSGYKQSRSVLTLRTARPNSPWGMCCAMACVLFWSARGSLGTPPPAADDASQTQIAGNATGFHADAGGYVRAEIGDCNTTAFAPSATTAGVVDEPPTIDLAYETDGD